MSSYLLVPARNRKSESQLHYQKVVVQNELELHLPDPVKFKIPFSDVSNPSKMRLGSPVGHSDPSSQMSSRQNDRWATSRGGKARRNSVHLSCKPPVKIVAHELAQQQGHR